MSQAPRGLSPAEAEAWARLVATVAPLPGKTAPGRIVTAFPSAAPAKSLPPPPPEPVAARPVTKPLGSPGGLDGSWERKLAKAGVSPDYTLDLHGHTLDAAYRRLDAGVSQALLTGARLLLVITGRSRPSDDHAGRGERRGAIRAKLLDWLAAGPHAGRIAAVRPAHPRHGGAGALYIVLRRAR